MVAQVEVGEGGIDILIRNELLKQHQTRDRKAVGAACLTALEQCAPPPLNWSTSYDKETEDQRWQSSVTSRKKSSPSYAR